MNRFAKKFRVLGGICVLLNLAAVFLPVIRRVQENYADVTWSQWDYIQNVLSKYIPFQPHNAVELTDRQVGCVLLFMVLPLLLCLTAGIWGMVGSYTQKVSSILVFLIFLLYGGMWFSIGSLWPETTEGQSCCRGLACTLTLAFSGFGSVLSLAALLVTPRKVKLAKSGIPQVEEVKQQQVEAKYSVVMEEKQEQRKEPVHGVLVGLTGLYAGAEIPLPDGEYILLGRNPDNHLVFEGQPKVSRNHCKIRWNEARQKYTFCDYSSTGSYANGAEDCLPQNLELELEPGTTVAIGDENNIFCLE